MAKLLAEPYPWEEEALDWSHAIEPEVLDAYFKRQADELEKLLDTGLLLSFPRADGYAYYLVVNWKPLTLQWVPYGDKWQVEPELIRGLRATGVRERLSYAKRLRSIFGKKKE